jgi:two-component system phosphate regulon sensor histidine kinase PhoR
MISFRALFLRSAAVATLVPLAALTVFLWRDQEVTGRAALDRQLRTGILASEQLVRETKPERVERALIELDQALSVRLTVIEPDGKVIADGEGNPERMENHLNRPEIQQARREGSGTAERHSATLNKDMRYLAVIQQPGGRIFRAAMPLEAVRSQVWRTQVTLLIAAGAVMLLALLVSARLARELGQPVDRLAEAAGRFSAGDRQVHVLPEGPRALQRLAGTFNEMVVRLDSQVRSLDEAQAYLEAVIRQMPEGLLVVDPKTVVTRVNPAAELLMNVSAERLLNRPLLAGLLNYALDQEVRRVLDLAAKGTEASGTTVDVRSPEKRSLRVAVGPFFIGGAEPRLAGAVLILQDLTELRRADDMRRDFVANVSHELRTPVAAIRAMTETLMLRGERRPELINDYGPRIVDSCERIDRLVQDLMLLAQTESGHLRFQPEALNTRELAEEVLRQVEPVAAQTETRLELGEFTDERALGDRYAVSQCIRNLVDNAVRYAAGGSVRVGSRVEDGHVIVAVQDDGPGIPPDALPRVFERFYRVDKARSREDGGSGLGLAIVRHLAEAQSGRAWVESRVGFGSTFFLALPIAANVPVPEPA